MTPGATVAAVVAVTVLATTWGCAEQVHPRVAPSRADTTSGSCPRQRHPAVALTCRSCPSCSVGHRCRGTAPRDPPEWPRRADQSGRHDDGRCARRARRHPRRWLVARRVPLGRPVRLRAGGGPRGLAHPGPRTLRRAAHRHARARASACSRGACDATYEVRSRRLVPQGGLVDDSWIFDVSGDARLTLVTCAPPYDRARGGYQNLAVVTRAPGRSRHDQEGLPEETAHRARPGASGRARAGTGARDPARGPTAGPA